jgi:class 3 adenylate cyclase
VAVRRAVIYAGVVALLTVVALFLITFRPYAVAVLLLPLLYWWPRFDARLNAWLYPQRARFPELIRDIGDEMASQTTIGGVLGVLAHAPIAMCGGRGATAFLFGSHSNAREAVSSAGDLSLTSGRPLAVERIVQLMVATKKEILRDHIAVEPQFSNIRDECYRGFERLGAVAVIPILRGNEVIGGLAVAPRETGDPYDSVDLQALATLAQQASQALGRIEATETLRAREREFADLKRFFPPQIIDQVMARGGAAELRSQRKLVTVFFADLRGFTSFSDSVEPEEVMATLAEYHAAMGQRIAEFAGTLERFAGDGFMVFFNDPVDQPDHADRAVSMALAMRRDIETLREGWAKKGYEIDVGMGIHSGYAACGFIGYEGRRDYGVIGNVTNLAARLSDAAKGGEILVTARVLAELRNQYHTEPLGDLTLKGFHQPQSVYRVLPVGETAWQK